LIKKLFNSNVSDNRERGQHGEDLAVQYLVKKAFGILERNYTIPAGELDIIARDQNILVFVEVKTLSSKSSLYEPEEQVTAAKRRRCEKAAIHWLEQNPFQGPCRFDVIGLKVCDGKDAEIYHIEDAWEEGE
jgi:putative endonuclease